MENKVMAEVVTIGSELVLGQLVDTNAAYIASCLAEIGVGLAFHTTVGDDWDRMLEAMKTAMGRAQIVITTGGIGPPRMISPARPRPRFWGRSLNSGPTCWSSLRGFSGA